MNQKKEHFLFLSKTEGRIKGFTVIGYDHSSILSHLCRTVLKGQHHQYKILEKYIKKFSGEKDTSKGVPRVTCKDSTKNQYFLY